MSAAYDTYDYPSYWIGREYEHKSELAAIGTLLKEIPQIKSILDIGGGFGRLIPSYSYRARKIILSDPSAKLLTIARKNFKKEKNIIYLHSSLNNLPKKLRSKSVDTVVMVRVLHHIYDIDAVFKIINSLLTDNGYFILEFANKSHLKAILGEFLKGNFTYPLDIFSRDLRTKRAKKAGSLPFVNYHPDTIINKLQFFGFNIIDKLSVSNIRTPFLKKLFSLETLINIEKKLQKPLSFIHFGPSIFILAQKRG